MNLAPVVLFVYNRPQHTKKTIEALQKNDLAAQSDLIIYSDAPKNKQATEAVEQVRALIRDISGFKTVTIIQREKNWGLASSIIDGVTSVINQYEKVIVLEDDLVTSPYFLNFMNGALDFYSNSSDIISITGFSFASNFMRYSKDFNSDLYLNIRPMSWSWATWKSQWDDIDWEIKDFADFIGSKKQVHKFNQGGTDLADMLTAQMSGKLDSWYIRWTYNAFMREKYTIYPRVSFVNNIGHDDTGVHCGVDTRNVYSHSELNLNKNVQFEKDLTLDKKVVASFNKAFDYTLKTKIKNFIRRMLKHAKVL